MRGADATLRAREGTLEGSEWAAGLTALEISAYDIAPLVVK